MSCGKDKNICDMIDCLDKVVGDIDSSKKINKEIEKAKKEMEVKANKAIDAAKEEFIMLLKKFNDQKWVIGEYKWMPIGSKMPLGWVKVELGKGLTLVQGDTEGNSVGALKNHFHVFEDDALAYGIDNDGVLFYINRPADGPTVPNEQLLFIKRGVSKQRWIAKTKVVGDGDSNLAAGKFAELWQFKGADYVKKELKKCLGNSIEESIKKCLDKMDKCCGE